MRFDRLSKAQGAYILGEAIGHERTAAVGECPVRRAVRHGFRFVRGILPFLGLRLATLGGHDFPPLEPRLGKNGQT